MDRHNKATMIKTYISIEFTNLSEDDKVLSMCHGLVPSETRSTWGPEGVRHGFTEGLTRIIRGLHWSHYCVMEWMDLRQLDFFCTKKC